MNAPFSSMTRRQAVSRLLGFFAFAFALAWVPWLAVILVKGAPSKIALIGLYAPAIAALVIAGVKGGRREVLAILVRLLPVRIDPRWWLLALLIMPAAYVFAAIAVGGGHVVHLLLNASSWWFLPLSLVYLLMITAGEEIGWRGYALPLLLQARVPPLLSAILLGLAWGAWHVPLRMPSGLGNFPLPLFFLFTTFLSIIYLILFQQSGGSLIPALLLHASTDFAPRVIDISLLPQQFWLVATAVLAVIAGGLCLLGYASPTINRTLR